MTRTRASPPWRTNLPRSKDKLQAQLSGARGATAHLGVGIRHVRRSEPAPEPSGGRGCIVPSCPLGTAAWVSVRRNVQNIEKLGAELGADPFGDFPLLGHRQIQQVQTIASEDVPSHGAQSSQSELTAPGPIPVAFDKHAALDVPENQGIGEEPRLLKSEGRP